MFQNYLTKKSKCNYKSLLSPLTYRNFLVYSKMIFLVEYFLGDFKFKNQIHKHISHKSSYISNSYKNKEKKKLILCSTSHSIHPFDQARWLTGKGFLEASPNK